MIAVFAVVAAVAAFAWAGCTKTRRDSSRSTTSGAAAVSGVPAVPDAYAAYVHAPIRIDGVLDEPAWQQATPLPLHDVGTGQPSPHSGLAGWVKVTWNATHLFMAAEIHDPEPRSPFARDEQDPHIWEQSSAVEWMIQPLPSNVSKSSDDNQTYFEIQVDVRGAVWDTYFDDYNTPITEHHGQTLFGHQSWQSGIERAAQVDASQPRYTLELAVPFSSFQVGRAASLSPPAPGTVWRMNMYAFRDGQRDSLAWSPIAGQGNFHKASRFGHVTFSK
jgi:hypothetical protein